jgi:hypothetical protein
MWLSALKPARINRLARPGEGTSDSRGARATTNASIHSPMMLTAPVLRPPAMTVKELCPTLPPTGIPPTGPEARLDPPWAKKWRFTSSRVPSVFG